MTVNDLLRLMHQENLRKEKKRKENEFICHSDQGGPER